MPKAKMEIGTMAGGGSTRSMSTKGESMRRSSCDRAAISASKRPSTMAIARPPRVRIHVVSRLSTNFGERNSPAIAAKIAVTGGK